MGLPNTPRERYLALLNGEYCPQVPRIPIVMQFAAKYIGSDYGSFTRNHKILCQANQRCARDFGFEQLSAISDPYRECHGFGAEIVFDPQAGAVCHQPPLENNRDLNLLKQPDPKHSARMLDRVNAINLYQQHRNEFSIMGWVEGPAAEAADLRGITHFMLDLLDDEDYAGALMDRCVETAIDFAKAQVDAGADTIGIGDAIASQVSAELYETFILPRERRLIDAIKNMGAYVRLHICGNITHLLPGIATLPIDILDIDHLVDLQHARSALGNELILAGNLDPVATIKDGEPDAIAAALQECQQAAGPRFMVAAGCEIPSKTPDANLHALCKPLNCTGALS